MLCGFDLCDCNSLQFCVLPAFDGVGVLGLCGELKCVWCLLDL